MAGNVVSNLRKYYGGQLPVPGQGDSDGKVKMLVEKTTTIEVEGVQTDVALLYDADDLTTPVTPQQLGQWTNENYLIVFKNTDADGFVRGFILYALATDHTSTDTLVNSVEFMTFKGDMNEPGASAFIFSMVEDSSTLTRYLRDEYGELIVKFDKASVEPGAQSDTLDNLIGTDTGLMRFVVVHEGDNAYLILNTEGLGEMFDDIGADLQYIFGVLDELPSDEHGYFSSSLYTTPGDGTTTNLVMDEFRISQDRDVHGDSIEFVPTRQEDGVDFGNVYLEPGTYILAIQYTLQWVGYPRGTFLPKVCNVADRPFDFSYEHEDVVHVTRIVTRTTRSKLVTNIAIDADTPSMGVWVKNMEVVQVASYSHPPVAHDTTLTGTGWPDSPLGVTPAAFGKIKDIPTSISQFRTGDVIAVDGPSGPAKMDKDDLLKETAQNTLAGNLAPAFDPTRTEDNYYPVGYEVVHNGKLYSFIKTHYGAWNAADVVEISSTDAAASRLALSVATGKLISISNDASASISKEYLNPVVKIGITRVADNKYCGLFVKTDLLSRVSFISSVYVVIKNVGDHQVTFGVLFSSSSVDWSQPYLQSSITLGAGEVKVLTYDVDADFVSRVNSEFGFIVRTQNSDSKVLDLKLSIFDDFDNLVYVRNSLFSKESNRSLSSEFAARAQMSETSHSSGVGEIVRVGSSVLNGGSLTYDERTSFYTMVRGSSYILVNVDVKKYVRDHKKLVFFQKNSQYSPSAAFIDKLLLSKIGSNWVQPVIDFLDGRRTLFARADGVAIVLDFSNVSGIDLDTEGAVLIVGCDNSGLPVPMEFSIHEYLGSTAVLSAFLFEPHQNDVPSRYITCWGDSLTNQGGWTTVLQNKTGLTVYNCGVGGEGANTILSRQGGDSAVVNGFTIPETATPVLISQRPLSTVLGRNSAPLMQGGGNVNPCEICGVAGTLSLSNDKYYFTRGEAGDAVVVDRPSTIKTNGDKSYNSPYLLIIFMGQNGGFSNLDELVAMHRLMIAHSQAEHVLVLGLSSGTASSRAEYESVMKAEFGRYFVSIREYLSHPILEAGVVVNCYGLADAGLTPTSDDLDAIAEGRVPPQCLADGVHYTTATKTVIGNMLYKKLEELNVF